MKPLPTPEELAAHVALGCAFDTPAMRALLEHAIRADREAIRQALPQLDGVSPPIHTIVVPEPGGWRRRLRVAWARFVGAVARLWRR